MSREEPVSEPLVMKEALYNYYDRTFEYALDYFNDHWSRIKDQPQLEEAYEIIQKFPETKSELEKIRKERIPCR